MADRYLLESGSPDGYLLEDGSGVLLLETTGFTVSLDAGSLSLTGQNVTLSYSGPQITISPGSLTLTGQTLSFLRGYVMPVTTGTLTLTGSEPTISAQLSEVFRLNLAIEIYVDGQVDHSHALTVGGTEVKLRSWSYEETDQSVYGTLNAQLNNLDQRSLLTSSAAINFSVNGQALLDTGRLDRKDYSISRQGIGSADDVTFVAMPEMEALLNKVPSVPTVYFDPERHEVTADDFEGIFDTENNYTPPVVNEVAGMTLYDLLQAVMVDICGFTDFVCTIDDFPILSVVSFDAGVAYWNTIANMIAMCNPIISTIDEGAGLILDIRDGTSGSPSGMPAPRVLSVSNASNMGVATELARVDSLLISVTKDKFYYDYYEDRTPEIETIDEGNQGLYGGEYTQTTITSYYRDFYRTSQPNTPVKTELRRQTTDVEFLPFGGIFMSTNENFYFDRWGRLKSRRKVTSAVVPDPFTSFVIAMTEIETEDEKITYKMHPFQPRTYYTSKREINKGGIIYIDGENPQLGTNYARDVINAYRSGNVVDTMSGVYGKISQFVETIEPRRNKRLKLTNYEIDFTPVSVGQSPIFLSGDTSEKDGEVGVNLFVQEQQKMYIFQEGETEIGGTIEKVNMGELPQEMAVALGNRILLQRNGMPNRVSFDIPYIDTSLKRGTPINAIGRNGEDLGNYIIEGRTLRCDAFDRGPRYSMSLQAREA